MNTRPQFASRIPLTALPPQIYYVHPLALHGMDAWEEVFTHARALGFDTILSGPLFDRGRGASIFTTSDFDRLAPSLGLGSDPMEAITALTQAARECELKFMLDLVIDQVATGPPPKPTVAADTRQ
jgi:starch synthase (maltosyl-transferring)